MRSTSREPHFATAGEVARNFGQWQDQAAKSPVIVTHHGRPRVVILSADDYASWVNDDEGGPGPSHVAFEASLAAVMNHTAEGFFALDSDLVLTAVNRVFEDFAGMAAASMIGRSWAELFPGAARSIAGEHFQRVLRTGEVSDFEMISTVRAGRVLSVRAFPYPDGMGVLFTNRTEERDLLKRLRGAGALEAALAAVGGAAVLEINLRGVIVATDAAFETLTGFTRAELQRHRLVDLLVPRFRAAVSDALERVFSGGRAAAADTVILGRNGRETPARMGLAAIDDTRAGAARVAVLPRG
jgi:PAS domain S-box-containing protein